MIPPDFGKSGGSPISNYDTILNEVDIVTNRSPPDVEYIVSLPFAYYGFSLFGIKLGFSYNHYGHSAIRYRRINEEGEIEDIVRNIEGYRPPNLNSLVKTYNSKEYIAGMSSQQGGLYNRNMLTVGYHDVEPENIEKMHKYFNHLEEKSLTGHKKFDILLGPIINRIAYLFPTFIERGNCTKWISEGLKEAKLIEHTHIWPKSLWITLFENENQQKKPSVILYKRATNCPQRYGDNDTEVSWYTAPFDIVRSFTYRNPQKFADCIVSVPNDDIKAIPIRNDEPIQPSKIRNIMNHTAFVTTTSIITGLVTIKYGKRGYMGFINIIKNNFRRNSGTSYKKKPSGE